MRTYWIYILASRSYGTLYIGVTNNLLGRVKRHREGDGSRFTSRYGVGRLVHFEAFNSIDGAIRREKSLKKYRRQWKIHLIEGNNPHWADLYPALRALPENRAAATQREMDPRPVREGRQARG